MIFFWCVLKFGIICELNNKGGILSRACYKSYRHFDDWNEEKSLFYVVMERFLIPAYRDSK